MANEKIGAVGKSQRRKNGQTVDGQTVDGSTGDGKCHASNPVSFCLSNALVWRALRSPLRLQLLEAIRARPGIDARALAKAIDSSPPRLYYHLNILLQSGLIVRCEESDRQGARGPAAVLYRPAFERFPPGFFDGDARTLSRRGRVMRELAELGLGYVVSERGSARVSADFRHETLLEQEIEAVFRHAAEIRRIIDAARMRRHRDKALERANAFVGICVSTLESAVLPDGPLETESSTFALA